MVEAKNLGDLYDLPLVDWGTVTARLDEGFTQAPGTGGPDRHTCWLATINPDGSPHVTGIDAIWVDDAFWFETGEHSRKGRNVARDPRCTLSIATREFDVVVEGDAHQVTDPPVVAAMAVSRGRNRSRAHGRFQRAVGRAAAVVRVSHHPARGDGALDRRARRRDAL